MGNSNSLLLGQILLRRGQIRKFQLNAIISLQKAYEGVKRKMKLGELMIRHRLITQHALDEALNYQSIMPNESLTGILNLLDFEERTVIVNE